MKLEVTEAQLRAIIEMTDTVSGMIGGLDEDFNNECRKQVKLIDAMLNKNGWKRKYK